MKSAKDVLPFKEDLFKQSADLIIQHRKNTVVPIRQWISEIEDTIKRDLESSFGLHLLPKTPSEKKRKPPGRPPKASGPTTQQSSRASTRSSRRKLDNTFSSNVDQSMCESWTGNKRMTRSRKPNVSPPSSLPSDASVQMPVLSLVPVDIASPSARALDSPQMFADVSLIQDKSELRKRSHTADVEPTVADKLKRVDKTMDEYEFVPEIPSLDKSTLGPSEGRLRGVKKSLNRRSSVNKRRSSQKIKRAKATLTIKEMKNNEATIENIPLTKFPTKGKKRSSVDEPPSDPPGSKASALTVVREEGGDNELIVVKTPRKSPPKPRSPIKMTPSPTMLSPSPIKPHSSRQKMSPSPIKPHSSRAHSPTKSPNNRPLTRQTRSKARIIKVVTPVKQSRESPVPSPPRVHAYLSPRSKSPRVVGPRSPRSPIVDSKALYKCRMTPSSLNSKINSFINRNTPKKTTQKEHDEIARGKLRQQEEREEEAKIRKERTIQEKADAARKKREDRTKRVAEAKTKQAIKEQEKIKRQEQRQAANLAKSQQIEEKKNAPRKPLKAIVDTEADITNVDVDGNNVAKKTFSVQEEEQQRKLEKVHARIQREKEEMERLKQKEEQKKLDIQSEKEIERERLREEEKLKATQIAQEKQLNAAIKKQNKVASTGGGAGGGAPAKNDTFNAIKNTSVLNNSQSYDMTPLRQLKASTATNYCIDDIRSSDETDDEDNPRKQIPSWAQGSSLKASLISQYYKPPDLDDLFGLVVMPDLTTIFSFQRKRFKIRTSSAHWQSPILPFHHGGRR